MVNPPQNPAVRKRFSYDEGLVRLNVAHNIPMSKQPTMFAVMVAHGKEALNPFMTNAIRYRAIPPKKLPAPTSKISFNTIIIPILNANILLFLYLLIRYY